MVMMKRINHHHQIQGERIATVMSIIVKLENGTSLMTVISYYYDCLPNFFQKLISRLQKKCFYQTLFTREKDIKTIQIYFFASFKSLFAGLPSESPRTFLFIVVQRSRCLQNDSLANSF
jgi:hypothetical protein